MKTWNSLLLLLLIPFWACDSESEGVKLSKKTLRISVYGSAKVSPDHEAIYYASTPGIIDDILVEEGEIVEAGTILIHINSEVQQLNQKNAALQKSIAQKKQNENWATLQNLKDQIALLKNRTEIDSLDYFKRLRLWEQNIGSQKELDLSRLQFQKSKNDYDAAKKQYQMLSAELKDQYQIALNQYQQANKNLKDHFITAKRQSLVYEIPVEEGQFVNNSVPLIYLGDSSQFIIELQIDENDISQIKLGQEVLLSLDAFDDQVFEAQISKIYPSKVERTQTFKVEAQFKNKTPKMFKGLSGEANIITDTKESVFCLPRAYVKNGQVSTEDGMIPVKTGAFNYEFIEILEGVDTNTLILLPE